MLRLGIAAILAIGLAACSTSKGIDLSLPSYSADEVNKQWGLMEVIGERIASMKMELMLFGEEPTEAQKKCFRAAWDDVVYLRAATTVALYHGDSAQAGDLSQGAIEAIATAEQCVLRQAT